MTTTVPRCGELSLILGPMFSGKSTMLMRRGDRLRHGRRQVLYLKPVLDQRYTSRAEIRSHQQQSAECVMIRGTLWETLFERVDGHNMVYRLQPRYHEVHTFLVDEVQFVSDALPTVERLLHMGHHVVAAGLSSDMRQRPWPVIGTLLARATHVKMLRACCMQCPSMSAAFSSRVTPLHQNDSAIGGVHDYEARCGACFTTPPETSDAKEEDTKQD